jgi:dsDNA-binding SOS-regulon protein
MEAFCRQRAKMDRYDEAFWLGEADALAKLLTKAHCLEEEERPPIPRAS